MKLFSFPYAPNPTKVELYLAEKRAAGCQIEIEVVTVNLLKGEQKEPEHLSRNPFGILPVLELDNGDHLIESLSIIEYLEDLHPTPSLYGGDAESRAFGRQLERIADLGVLLPIAGAVHATNSPLDRPPQPEIARNHQARLTPHLDYLNTLLGDGRPFLAGHSVTVADCTLAAALQFGRFRELEFIGQHAELQRWDAAYRQRETAAGILLV